LRDVCHRLRSFADFAAVMELEMELARETSQDVACLTDPLFAGAGTLLHLQRPSEEFPKLRLLRLRSPLRSQATLNSSFLALALTLRILVDEAR
jgi:hypothetical protein